MVFSNSFQNINSYFVDQKICDKTFEKCFSFVVFSILCVLRTTFINWCWRSIQVCTIKIFDSLSGLLLFQHMLHKFQNASFLHLSGKTLRWVTIGYCLMALPNECSLLRECVKTTWKFDQSKLSIHIYKSVCRKRNFFLVRPKKIRKFYLWVCFAFEKHENHDPITNYTMTVMDS